MITAEDIQLLIGSGEGYNVEFKVSVPSKVRELTEEVCAFANAAGGVVLIGVDDQNTIKGVTIDNQKRSAIQNSISEITPNLHCEISHAELEGRNIVVIEVPSGPNKPYVYSGAIYVRIGPNSQKLTTAEQMRDFFQRSDKIYFDEGLCKEFSPTLEIDRELFNEFKSLAHLDVNVADYQIFSNLKLFAENDRFKNGAVLFFGKEPELYFEKATTRCVAFKGLDKRYIIDDKSYGGPLLTQFRKAIQWLYGKLDVSYDIEGQGSGPRKEIWEIPETVLKEAIINSLSHRDYYDKGATITIELFDDRVEISNPGGLVSAITPAEFGKRSHSRNPLIFGLFARMHLVEQIGSGIIRMKDLMKEAGLNEPAYRTEGFFTVIFNRPLDFIVKTVEKTVEEIILELIEENPKITLKTLIKDTRQTKRKVEYQINKLKNNGILERLGVGKSGYWQLKNHTNLYTVEDRKGTEKETETMEEIILNLIQGNPRITFIELMKATNKSKKTIEYQINKLKSNKLIIRFGPNKGGYWQIIREINE